jgi:iron complex outermembrane receptor protein
MAFRKTLLIGSASAIAMICSAAPAFAADPATQSDEVVVTGIGQSLEKAIEIKRISTDQVDAISATDIGKLPDRNVADALQRLPGVNTSSAASGEGGFDENDRVSIRGTSPSLTQVTIDGHAVATGDWFILDQFQTVGRSVSFDLLPAEVVQGVDVYKTQDASLLEGGVAGVVDIQTRDPLKLGKQYTIEGSVQGAYNSLSKETKPQFNALFGWKSADDTLGVILQGFHEERSVERFGQETLGYTTITQATLDPVTGKINNGGSPATLLHPDLAGVTAPTLIGSSLFQQEKKRDGGFAAIAWAPTSKFEVELSGFYSKLDATNHNDNYMYWGSNEINNNSPTSYTVKNGTLVAANWGGSSATLPAGEFYADGSSGGEPVKGLVVDNIVRPNASGESYYINLDGKYHVSDHLTFKGQIGFTQGIGDTPTEPAYEVDGGTSGIAYAPSGNGWQVTPAGINPQSPAGLANDWAWNETFRSVDKEMYAKFDGDWEVDNGAIKDVTFGARTATHTRQVDGWDRGCSLGANGQCWTSPAQPFSATNPSSYPSGFSAGALGVPGLLIPIAGNPASIVGILNGITDGVHGPISSIKQPQNYYWLGSFKVNETDYEGYVMAKIGGDGWRGNIGVRIADTKETPHANISDPTATIAHPNNPGDIFTSAYGPYYATNKTYDYFDVLPSLNLTFDLQKNVLLRMSAAETMSRPDFSALGGTVSLSDLNLTGNGGNPQLKPIKAAVYDVAAEWYYAPKSVAAISVFYDDISSYVTYGLSNQTYFSQFYNGFRTYSVTSPLNTSGELKGIELQVQQPIGYGFGFQANFTYVDGHEVSGAPLVGTSRETYNLVGYYEDHGVSARLAYTFRSHYFVGLDRSAAENQDDYGTLDGSLAYQLTPKISFNIDALNMTNSLLKYYAANKSQPRAVYENGTQWYGGFHFKF